MPAIKVYGRRWFIGTDDVPWISLITLPYHFVWAVLIPIWVVGIATGGCTGSQTRYYVYALCMWAGMVFNTFWDLHAIVIGSKGGMFETAKRRSLEVGALMFFPKAVIGAGLSAWGIVMVCLWNVCDGGSSTTLHGEATFQALVWTHFPYMLLRWGILIITFNSFPDFEDPSTWEKRCRFMTTFMCMGGHRVRYTLYENSPDVLRRLAKIMATTFSNIDMTPTDILASMWVAARMQKWERRRLASKKFGGQWWRDTSIRDEAAGGAAAAAAAAAGGIDVEASHVSAFHTSIITPLGSEELVGDSGESPVAPPTPGNAGGAGAGGGEAAWEAGVGARSAAGKGKGKGKGNAAPLVGRRAGQRSKSNKLASVTEECPHRAASAAAAANADGGAALPRVQDGEGGSSGTGGGSPFSKAGRRSRRAGSQRRVASKRGPPADGSFGSGGSGGGAERAAEVVAQQAVEEARQAGLQAELLTPISKSPGSASSLFVDQPGFDEVGLGELSSATHFMNYAFAAYGWKLYTVATYGVVGNPLALLCKPRYGRHKMKKHLLAEAMQQQQQRRSLDAQDVNSSSSGSDRDASNSNAAHCGVNGNDGNDGDALAHTTLVSVNVNGNGGDALAHDVPVSATSGSTPFAHDVPVSATSGSTPFACSTAAANVGSVPSSPRALSSPLSWRKQPPRLGPGDAALPAAAPPPAAAAAAAAAAAPSAAASAAAAATAAASAAVAAASAASAAAATAAASVRKASKRSVAWVQPLSIESQLNYNAILLAAKLQKSDLIFVRYEGEKPLVLPYFIALDHGQQSVVLSIRGTMTIEDCLTDVLYEPASLDEWLKPSSISATDAVADAAADGSSAHRHRRRRHNRNNGSGGSGDGGDGSQPGSDAAAGEERVQRQASGGVQRWEPPRLTLIDRHAKYAAHSGMLEAARAVLHDIANQDVLRRILLDEGYLSKGWDLVVTGHSLGAGVASLVGLHLRQYIGASVRVWAFSPPGGTLSPAAADLTKEFITSVSVGKDIVPRLNARSFDNMHCQTVEAASRCRVSKVHILTSVLLRRKWKEEQLVYPEGDISAEAQQALDEYRERKLSRPDVELEVERCCYGFTAPGRMIFLRPLPLQKGLRGKDRLRLRFKPVWIDPRLLVEEGILFSRRMWSDHFPWYVLAVLRALTQAGAQHQDTAEVGAVVLQATADGQFAVADSAAHGDTAEGQQLADRIASSTKQRPPLATAAQGGWAVAPPRRSLTGRSSLVKRMRSRLSPKRLSGSLGSSSGGTGSRHNSTHNNDAATDASNGGGPSSSGSAAYVVQLESATSAPKVAPPFERGGSNGARQESTAVAADELAPGADTIEVSGQPSSSTAAVGSNGAVEQHVLGNDGTAAASGRGGDDTECSTAAAGEGTATGQGKAPVGSGSAG